MRRYGTVRYERRSSESRWPRAGGSAWRLESTAEVILVYARCDAPSQPWEPAALPRSIESRDIEEAAAPPVDILRENPGSWGR